jgi:exoribonuclease-2
MNEQSIGVSSLVIYKNRPARVARCGERLEIELETGNQAKVREKDITFLHAGPIQSLAELRPQEGELELSWEILKDDPEAEYDLAELAELIYGANTPASAWAAWQHLEDGLYFHGKPGSIKARSSEEVEQEQNKRQAKAAQAQAWGEFLERAKNGQIQPEGDARFLRETEDLAYGRRKDSRLLRELGYTERPENAQRLLLKSGCWDESTNPHPARLGLSLSTPTLPLPPLPDEQRLDLTNMPAFAIDDRQNKDPDDAISLEDCQFDGEGNLLEGSLWVHIADVAALAPPDSAVDLEARARGATLYLPEGSIPMLPSDAVQLLGLGLEEISPALSFRLTIDGSGEIIHTEYQPSWMKVQRLSYEEAEKQLDSSPFREMQILAAAYQARRKKNRALFIDMPEVIMHVTGKEVDIRPLERLHSRNMVREAMLMTGEAAGKYAVEHQIPFPFVTQLPPDTTEQAAPLNEIEMHLEDQTGDGVPDYAAFFEIRRKLNRSQVSSLPAPHAGVGLPVYSRATSPLRRYLDLVVHQQLRAHLRGDSLIQESDLLERVGASEAVIGSVNNAEHLSRRHWTLVYLMQNPGWETEGFLIDRKGLRGRILLPDLALEIPVHLREEKPLNSRLRLKLKGVNLPELEAHFEVL